jgi:uncharacterized membrane protein
VNLAHVHLLLNHFPTIGFMVGMGLFIFALLAKSEVLQRASLVIFFLIAAISIPTYISGNSAAEILRKQGVSVNLITAHEDAAFIGSVFMGITGFVAWIGLWRWRYIARLSGGTALVVLLLSLITFGLMTRASNLGGKIRHPEIRSAAEAGAATAAPSDRGLVASIGSELNDHFWALPICQSVHLVGLSIIFLVVLLVNLRILGVAKGISLMGLYSLLPLGIVGFGINLLTGMFLFIASTDQFTTNIAFFWKIGFILAGAFNLLYFMLVDRVWTIEAGDDAPITEKLVAGSALFVWVAVLFCGQMLTFLGNAF